MIPGDKNQLELEDLGKLVAYYLYSLDRPITFVFVTKKNQLTDVQKLQLNPMSKQSKRIRDSVQLTTISNALERIESELKKSPRVEHHFEKEIIEKEVEVEKRTK